MVHKQVNYSVRLACSLVCLLGIASLSPAQDCAAFRQHHLAPGHDDGFNNLSMTPGWHTQPSVASQPPSQISPFSTMFMNDDCEADLLAIVNTDVTLHEGYQVGGEISASAEFEAAAGQLIARAAITAGAAVSFNGSYSRTQTRQYGVSQEKIVSPCGQMSYQLTTDRTTVRSTSQYADYQAICRYVDDDGTIHRHTVFCNKRTIWADVNGHLNQLHRWTNLGTLQSCIDGCDDSGDDSGDGGDGGDGGDDGSGGGGGSGCISSIIQIDDFFTDESIPLIDVGGPLVEELDPDCGEFGELLSDDRVIIISIMGQQQ